MFIKKYKINRPFPSCFEPHYESEAKCKVFFFMKISSHSYANKTNFIVRFTATWKWSIGFVCEESSKNIPK